MKIVLFEDADYENFLPLTYFRPVWDLRCGIYTLEEKLKHYLASSSFFYSAREYLLDYYLPQSNSYQSLGNEECLFVNGRLLMSGDDPQKILDISSNSVLLSGNSVVAWRTEGKSLQQYISGGIILEDRICNDFSTQKSNLNLVKYPWDLIDQNGSEIVNDSQFMGNLGQLKGTIEEGVHIVGKENVYLAESARVMPGVVIDAKSGPVWIDQNARIMPQAVLEGPLAIGRDSVIKIGAKIYENSTIGPVCKVGGEVEESIFHSYSNKQHDGFLGHSYLGSWINLGADTNNSDLKNNYGEISVMLNNRKINTGKRFLGAIIGDHTKTSINTMINTGSVIGVCCNIFGEGFPPKFVPSFSWGGSAGFQNYDFEKALQLAKIVMERRKVSFTDNQRRLFQAVKELCAQFEKKTA